MKSLVTSICMVCGSEEENEVVHNEDEMVIGSARICDKCRKEKFNNASSDDIIDQILRGAKNLFEERTHCHETISDG